MPIFNVTAPDGTVIEVNAPEGATEAQAISYAQSQYKAPTPAAPSAATAEVPSIETYRQAGAKISAATPQVVKDVGSAVASGAGAIYEASPELVQQSLKKTGNFLMDALDYLSRPGQAVLGGAKEMRQIEREQPPVDMSTPFGMLNKTMQAMTPEAEKRIQTAALKGLKGEAKTGTLEALPQDFRENNPIIASVIGFAGDSIVDRAALGAPFQALKETVIKPIAGAVSVPGKLADNELYKAFMLRSKNIDKADELYAQFRFSRDKAVNEGIRDAKALNKEIKVLSKQTGISVDDLKAKIVNDIETGQIGDDAIGALEQNIVSKYKSLLEEQQAAGIKIGDLGENYFPHIRSKELDDIVNKQALTISSRPSAKNTQALQREIDDTVQNINAKALYGDDAVRFRNDPAVVQGIYEFKAANAIAGKKILDDVSREFGVDAAVAPKNYVSIPEIPGVKFPPEVKSRIVRIHGIATNDQAINKFLQVVDGTTNWWKMWSLGVRPSYHTKNAIGNLWNNYLAGVDNPLRYKDAAVVQYKIAQNNLDGTIYGKPVKEIYEEMANRGVIGEGQYGADVAQVIESKLGINQPLSFNNLRSATESLKQIAGKTVGTENPLLKGGFAVGSAIEDNARVALFLDRVKKGASYEDAGKAVQKYLFDYGSLSPFEQNVMKRAMPFYTWSRKNIPLQLEALVTSPEKINKINIFKQNVEAGVEKPVAEDVPDYVKDQMPVYISNPITGKSTAIPLSGILPFADLNLLTNAFNTGNRPTSPFEKGKISSAASTATGSLNPVFKEPVQLLLNYDFFRKKNIREFEGQEVDFLGMKIGAKTAHTISNFILANEVDRLNPNNIFGTRTKDEVTGQITTTPSIFGNMRESRTDAPEAERGLQTATGIRQIKFDPAEVSSKNWVMIKKDLEDAKKQIYAATANSRTDQQKQLIKTLEEYLVQVNQWDKEARESRKKKQ
jgi:hypothetical protein